MAETFAPPLSESGLSGRPLTEALSRVPEKSRAKIFGKPWTDIARDAAGSAILGAAFNIGLRSTGVSGVALAAAAGGGVSGVKEHFKATNANWHRMQEEQHVDRLGLKDTLRGFFKQDREATKRIAFAVGTGAAFAATGNLAAAFIGESVVGDFLREKGANLKEFAEGKITELAHATASSVEAANLEQTTPPDADIDRTESTETPVPTSVPKEGFGRNTPFEPVAEVAGGLAHNVGLKMHEATGFGLDETKPQAPGRGLPLIGNQVDIAGGAFHNAGLKVHEVTGLGFDRPEVATAEPVMDTSEAEIDSEAEADELEIPTETPEPESLEIDEPTTDEESVPEGPQVSEQKQGFLRNTPLEGPADIIGGLFHNVGLKASEIRGLLPLMPWDPKGSFIDPGTYFPSEVKIPENAPEWIKDINNIDGEYGQAIQAEVGKHLPDMQNQTLSILEEMANQNQQFKGVDGVNAINHVQHIMEDKANRAFDGALKGVVEGSQDLEEARRIGQESFAKWLQDEADKDIRDGIAQIIDTRVQIDQTLTATPSLIEEPKVIPAGQSPFDIFFPKDADTNNEYLKKVIPNMAANIAANQNGLLEAWLEQSLKTVGVPESLSDLPTYEAYMGELNYLMKRAEAGDIAALQRLKDAFKYSVGHDWEFKRLSADGIKRMLELIKPLG